MGFMLPSSSWLRKLPSMHHAKAELKFSFKIMPAALAVVIVWILLVRLTNENRHCFEDSWKEKLSSALPLIL